MKKLKKLLVMTTVASAMAMAVSGCSLKQLNEAERAEQVIQAYQTGDIKAFKSYVGDDDRLNYLLDAQGVENADGMIEVYQKVYELTKNAEVTVTEIPDDASSDYANVTIKTVDFTDAINEAMLEAVAEGGEAFADVPTWMMKALNTGGEVVEKEVQVRTHKSGNLFEGFNKEFFDALTGGFYGLHYGNDDDLYIDRWL